MQVTSTNSATNASTTSSAVTSAAASANIDYNSFLKLLITELQNQDPTSPMDPTQSISQLASFSAVEQQVETNSKLDAILTSSALSQADDVIGRTLTSSDGTVSGKVTSVTISASGATATLDSGDTLALGSGVTVS